MRKLAIIFTSLLLLSACSNEMSAEEKRNKFDGCVIEQMSDKNQLMIKSAAWAKWEFQAQEFCRHWLD